MDQLNPKDAKAVKNGQDLGKPDAMVVRSQSSVVVKTSAKGDASWEIKVYSDNPEEAAAKAVELHKKLKKDLAE